ncbi:hypothetical protein D3C78_1399130 [compost metagenome]
MLRRPVRHGPEGEHAHASHMDWSGRPAVGRQLQHGPATRLCRAGAQLRPDALEADPAGCRCQRDPPRRAAGRLCLALLPPERERRDGLRRPGDRRHHGKRQVPARRAARAARPGGRQAQLVRHWSAPAQGQLPGDPGAQHAEDHRRPDPRLRCPPADQAAVAEGPAQGTGQAPPQGR